ncbi:hypothetical protein ARTHRO9V_240126 [Arthrobacter sp. 9V]|nr:hypothetical protein ARTHRO9V_240126 [Arthrobacter sp. 9V]
MKGKRKVNDGGPLGYVARATLRGAGLEVVVRVGQIDWKAWLPQRDFLQARGSCAPESGRAWFAAGIR